VDILIGPDGVIYISDDKAGVVYQVVYEEMIK
jgi:glucose/arabinose dehydrogenase